MTPTRDLRITDRREWLWGKLERIMDKVEHDSLPMYIKEVYLFGSFLKGKEDPKDIDIVLIYDSDKTAKMYETIGRKGDPHWRMGELRRAPSRLRGRLKENAERTLDFTICPSLEEFKRDLPKELDCCLRIWSEEARDWRSRLSAYLSGPDREA